MKPFALPLVFLAASCATVARPPAPNAASAPSGAPVTIAAYASNAASAASAADPRSFSGSVNFYYGVRALDEGDWSPVENQVAFGIETVLEKPDSAVGFEFAVFGSGNRKDDVSSGAGQFDVRGHTAEISAGLHKTFNPGNGTAHPFVGGGVSAIRAEFHGENGGSSATDDDNSLGLYLHGGVAFDLSANLFVAFDLRFLGGTDMEIFHSDVTADYGQAALVFGVRF